MSAEGKVEKVKAPINKKQLEEDVAIAELRAREVEALVRHMEASAKLKKLRAEKKA